MKTQTRHEPETKPTNKVRGLQDVMIHASKCGLDDPLEIAESIYDWFIDSPRGLHIAVLQYAIARLQSTTAQKMAPRVLSASRTAAVKAAMAAELDRKWLDLVVPMTGAQVRAAKMLPDAMADQVGDNQRVGEVFTLEQLKEVAP